MEGEAVLEYAPPVGKLRRGTKIVGLAGIEPVQNHSTVVQWIAFYSI
jgi:hypothetical protein